ncbi:MAG: hypothetical protein Q8M07_06545 [Prosthecobacter sp.]|nr:hypothetical protein [Prosthecobacter sp.]
MLRAWALFCSFVILNSAFDIQAAPPPELTVLRQQYDKVVAERVSAPFDAGLAELNTKYTAGLDRAIADAKAAGKLEDILAIEAEKKRLADKLPIPATDDAAEPEALKKYRVIYRQQHAVIEATRAKTHADLLPPYTAKLKDLEAVLVKNDRVDEAKEVLAYRQGLAQGGPLSAVSGSSGPETANAPQAPAQGTERTTLMPAADVPKGKGDDRKAAEWVLANWSDSRLFVDEKHIQSAAELPKGKFTVTSISVDGRFYTGAAPLSQAVLLENLGGLTGVTYIGMAGFPDLKDEDFAFIGTLPGLEELKLGKLNCTDAMLGHLKGLKKLRSLDFDELRNLTGTGFAQLADLPVLEKIIHLRGGMTDEGVAAIAKLPGITSLDIKNNPGVTNACIPHLPKMPKLTGLYLSKTGITPEGFEGVSMPKITRLAVNALANFSLRELSPKFAISFPNVEVFALSHLADTAEDLAALAHFKKLRVLSNSGIIKDEALPGLLELRELVAYYAYLNEISPAAWETLAKLKKLKNIKFGTKPPNEAALAAFKKQRPDVKVEP